MLLFIPLVAIASAEPVTVLEHTVDVSARSAGPRWTQTWRVRIDDPEAAMAGVQTPPGLDGTSADGATIDEGYLLIPPGLEEGAELIFTTPLQRGWTGWVHTAPALVTERFEVNIDHVSGDLEVWFSGAPAREVHKSGARSTGTFVWTDTEGAAPPAVAWSTWKDWSALGDELQGLALSKVANRSQLGIDVIGNPTAMSPTEAWQRTEQFVPYDRTWPEGWEAARPADEVLASGSGSAAERGLVMLSLLMAGQIRCEVAGGRSNPDAPPAWLPAYESVSQPMVAAQFNNTWVWLDPLRSPAASEAYWGGRTVWRAGALPEERPLSTLTEQVHVSGTWTVIDADTARFRATLSASESAAIWLRERLGPLDDAGRAELLGQLIAQAHGEASAVTVVADGMQAQSGPLRISMQGRLPRDERHLRPLLAPQLLGWLPAFTEVSEDLRIEAPPSQPYLGHAGGGPRWSEAVWLARQIKAEPGRVVLSTRGERVSDAAGTDRLVADWTAEASTEALRIYWGNTSGGEPVSMAVQAALAQLPASWQKRAWREVDWTVAARQLARFAPIGPAWSIPLAVAPDDPSQVEAARRLLEDPVVEGRVRKRALAVLSNQMEEADPLLRGLALLALAKDPLPPRADPSPQQLLELAWQTLQEYPEQQARVALAARTLHPERAAEWLASSAPTPEVVAAELPGRARAGAPRAWVLHEAVAALSYSRTVEPLDDAAEALLIAGLPRHALSAARAAELLAPSPDREQRRQRAETLAAEQRPPAWPSMKEPTAALETGWAWLADEAHDRSALLARQLLRDGRVPEAEVLWWAATAGRRWRTDADARLRALSDTPRGADVDFEHRLLAGTWQGPGDPYVEQGQALLAMGRTPPSAEEVPTGWRRNPLLSVAGAEAWNSPVGDAVILVAPASDGVLPAPLDALYTPGARSLDGRRDGSRLHWLSGGVMPLYAATLGGEGRAWRVGLAPTPELAWAALDAR